MQSEFGDGIVEGRLVAIWADGKMNSTLILQEFMEEYAIIHKDIS